MRTLAHHDDRAAIAARLRELRAESGRRWGKMSPHQMVCHLNDAFEMALGRRQVGDISGFFQRTLVKAVALYLPLPWPRGVLPTIPELDQQLGGTRPAEFAQDLARTESLLDLVATQPTSFRWPPHPLFGPMSHASWLRWAYLHTDHHLRQFGA